MFRKILRSTLRLTGFFVLPVRDQTGKSLWLAQRVTAIAMLPLYVWLLLVAFPNASTANHSELTAWIQDPVHATLIYLTIVFSLYHMVLGLDTIVDDYIATPALNKIALLGVRWGTFCFQLLVLAAIFHLLWQA